MNCGGDFSHVTLCFTTPRSRSQWLTWFYSFGVESWHDPTKNCHAPRDLKGMIEARKRPDSRLFIADTGAILFHDALLDALPGVRCLYVLRPAADIAASLRRETGFLYTSEALDLHERVRRRAFAGPPQRWSSFESLNVRSRLWWPGIVGREFDMDSEWRRMCAQVIGVPLLDQEVDVDARASLLQYKEKPPAG